MFGRFCKWEVKMHNRRSSRKILFVFSFLMLFLLLMLSVSAEETQTFDTMPDSYSDWLQSLPPELLDRLPAGIFSTDSEEVGDAVGEMGSFSFLLKTVLALVGVRLEDCLRLLCSILGILLLAAVCRTLCSGVSRPEVAKALTFLVSLVITVTLFASGFASIESTVSYFRSLNAFTSAAIPLMGGLYVMGGNASAAVSTSAGLTLFMTVLEELVGKSIVPFCGICLALALVGACEGSVRVGCLLSTLKKKYTLILSFFMMLLLAMLGAQTMLGNSRDTLAMRSAKFAAGSMIPVVGGSIAELLRSVSAGIGYLRGAVGICGVLLLLLLLLPTLVELLLVRTVWQLGASVADLLGCDGEKKLLDEFASINGYLIAAVAICSSVLFLTLTLFARCACAIS